MRDDTRRTADGTEAIGVHEPSVIGGGRIQRLPPGAGGCRSAPAKAGVPVGEYARRERGRRRTRQDQISYRAFGPVKLRIVKDTRTERRKPVSSAGPSLKEVLPKMRSDR